VAGQMSAASAGTMNYALPVVNSFNPTTPFPTSGAKLGIISFRHRILFVGGGTISLIGQNFGPIVGGNIPTAVYGPSGQFCLGQPSLASFVCEIGSGYAALGCVIEVAHVRITCTPVAG
jgi:hypothetical protein